MELAFCQCRLGTSFSRLGRYSAQHTTAGSIFSGECRWNLQCTASGKNRWSKAFHLYCFLVLLRNPRSLSDPGMCRDSSPISLRLDQEAWRRVGDALGAGLWFACPVLALFQCLWTPVENLRNVWRGVRCFPGSEAGGETVHSCRR